MMPSVAASSRTRKRPLSSHLQALRADVLSGLAVTRLIFNKDRSEDAIIEEQLQQALQIREATQDSKGVADVLNSAGSLKQKQQ